MFQNIDKEMIRKIIPVRAKDAHKGDFGRVLIIAGSEGMMGAAILALQGALKSGAGLVTVSCDSSFFPIVHCKIPEALCKSRELSIEDLKTYDSIAIGPGLGVSKATEMLVRMLLEHYDKPVVIDADALNSIAKYNISTAQCNAKLIMTPHEAEAARLLSVDVKDIRNNRKSAAEEMAKKFEACCVLKGAETLVVSSDSEIFINSTGNPGMATGGSGDVLTGVLASFLAQFTRRGVPLINAVSAGVYIHGLAGDLAAGTLGEYGLIAGDIAANIPFAIREMIHT